MLGGRQAICLPFVGEPADTIPVMRPLHEIRRENLARLVADAGGQAAFSARIGKDKNQVYQWLLPETNPQHRKLSHRTARAIEAATAQPGGWLDTENPESGPAERFVPGEAGVKKHRTETGPASHFGTIDPVMIAEAEKWVRYEEAAGAKFQPVRRAERLIALYSQILAGGGVLPPVHIEAIIDAARRALAQGERQDGDSSRPKAG